MATKAPSLSIAAAITRLRAGITTSFTQTLVNVFTDIQNWANTVSGQVGNLNEVVADVSSTGKVTFTVINLAVSVDQVGNKLVFQVQYADGTIKMGSVNLV